MRRIVSCFLLAVMLLLPLSQAYAHTPGYDGMGPKVITGGRRDFAWPVPGYENLQSCFYDHRNHYAIDIAAPAGVKVVAAYDGTVIKTYSGGYGDGFGNYVVLRHDYTLLDGKQIVLYSRYNHLSAVTVSVGDRVTRGVTQVGKIGSTGNSQGNHLDFQILYGGWQPYRTYSIDPYANELLVLPENLVVYDRWDCGESYFQLVQAVYSEPLVHTCDKGEFLYCAAEHPHGNYYRCSICGDTWLDTDSANRLEDCSLCTTPGKPALTGLTAIYTEGQAVSFRWAAAENATHYGLYIDRMDGGKYQRHENIYPAESGLGRSLPVGQYRVLLQSVNAGATDDAGQWLYTDGDWAYFTVAAKPAVDNPFSDMHDGRYDYVPVLWAVEQGIASGVTASRFAPDASCTRAQVVTFLWRAAGSPEPSGQTSSFSDVAQGQYYTKAVQWATAAGIAQGVGGGRFAPDETVTRAQFVTFLWRAMGRPGHSGNNPFTDLPSGSYYYAAALWAAGAGITNGAGNGRFLPESFCTRGQAVTFLHRAYA